MRLSNKYHNIFALLCQQWFCMYSIVVDCGGLKNPENGQVAISGTDFGSNARYRCLSGYILVGDDVRMCQENGDWSGEEPVCQCKLSKNRTLLSQLVPWGKLAMLYSRLGPTGSAEKVNL